jgi:hypothetical protein
MSARPRGAIRLIFPAGCFNSLPKEALRGGPWTGTRTGEIARLTPEYRRALARDGYVRIEGVPAEFSPETSCSQK